MKAMTELYIYNVQMVWGPKECDTAQTPMQVEYIFHCTACPNY